MGPELQQYEQLRRRLVEALSALNEEEQQLIRALYWEGVSAREYARRLGVYYRSGIGSWRNYGINFEKFKKVVAFFRGSSLNTIRGGNFGRNPFNKM